MDKKLLIAGGAALALVLMIRRQQQQASTSISNVAITGSGASANIVVTGTGFGTVNHALPFTGDLPYFTFRNVSRLWDAGYTDPSYTPNTITLKYVSWSDKQIVIGGFAGQYGQNNFVLNNGDHYKVTVVNPQTGHQATFEGVY